MIASAGSKRMRTEEITRALFPIAGGFMSVKDNKVIILAAGALEV